MPRQVVTAEISDPTKDVWRPSDLPTAEELTRIRDRRGRLLRWGWPAPEAERLAARLLIRDRAQDDRVSCADCVHYMPRHCGNHRRAGLSLPALGRDLASQLQRCPGFEVASLPTEREVSALAREHPNSGTPTKDADPTA